MVSGFLCFDDRFPISALLCIEPNIRQMVFYTRHRRLIDTISLYNSKQFRNNYCRCFFYSKTVYQQVFFKCVCISIYKGIYIQTYRCKW